MGLFSSKKKDKVEKNDLPPLKFPDLPQKGQQGFPEFPKGNNNSPEEQEIQRAVKPAPNPTMPNLQPAMEPMGQPTEEKPLFVKVETYREVMATLNELKERLKSAGDILTELNKIKNKEEKELQGWHTDLENLKEKLINIDKLLFES